MRLISWSAAICLMLAPLCVAQTWEIGTSAGYGLYHNTSISNDAQSATAGVHSGSALGAVFGENPYDYIGGELRYLYRWGSPELQYREAKPS